MKSNLSASPLHQGERIEVRGQFDSVYVFAEFQPAPCPLPFEGRGDTYGR